MLDHKYIHPICSKSNHNHSDIHATLHFCLFQESQDTRHSPLPAKFRRYHYHYYISHTMLQGKTGRLLMYTTFGCHHAWYSILFVFCSRLFLDAADRASCHFNSKPVILNAICPKSYDIHPGSIIGI